VYYYTILNEADKGIEMQLSKLLLENGVDLKKRLSIGETVEKTFSIKVDQVDFDITAILSCKGEIELYCKTPISSFPKRFIVSYDEYHKVTSKRSRINVSEDFSLSGSRDNLDNVIAMAKFNILIAEFIKEIVADEDILAVFESNCEDFRLAIDQRNEENKLKRKADKQARKVEFEANETILTDKEISKLIRDVKAKSESEYCKPASIVFKVINDSYEVRFVRVTYKNSNLHVQHGTKLDDVPQEMARNHNKSTLRNAKDRLFGKAFAIAEDKITENA
tara:strand:- start:12027 stop:12860 length:834 start_codon:yes stop_codon:yes gene_type:complete